MAAGWHVRSLDPSGHYVAELLSECPPYRHLTCGCLLPWDNLRVRELGKCMLLFGPDTLFRPPSYTGFFGVKTPDEEKPLAYYYSAGPTENPQTQHFLEMVAVLDPYFAQPKLDGQMSVRVV